MLKCFIFLAECKNTAYFSRSTVTSSSELSPQFSAAHASLSSSTAWCPQQNFTDNEYLQVSLNNEYLMPLLLTLRCVLVQYTINSIEVAVAIVGHWQLGIGHLGIRNPRQ